MRIDVTVETPVSRSGRAQQLSAMFDVPPSEVARLSWTGDVPIEAEPWSVGLIVGPSGSGKSTLLRGCLGAPLEFAWSAPSVLDDFAASLSITEIAGACQAVGFNTIPAWLRPFAVLSMGERFRVELARRLLETPADERILIDEFTSVVDRQVAQIGAHAVQKWVRRHGRQVVCATCHYDVVEWLQPDWILEPATMTFARRSVQRRPAFDAVIQRVPYAAWGLFAPFHYLTRELHRAARCFVLFANGYPAAFSGVLNRPHPKSHDIMGCSRLVTLPDWQGLGCGPILNTVLASAYRAIGKRYHTYPAHPALIRVRMKDPQWACVKLPGQFKTHGRGASRLAGLGGRPCAVFEYRGPAMGDVSAALAMLDGQPGGEIAMTL